MNGDSVCLTVEAFFQLPMAVVQAIEAGAIKCWLKEGRVHVGVTPQVWSELLQSCRPAADRDARAFAAEAGEA